MTNQSLGNILGSGEPYRLLFPLGALLGILGVMLWPAAVWAGAPYPYHAHAGIMIQGFLSAFVIGFLGTALPRLLEVKRVGGGETVIYAAGLVLTSTLHLLDFRFLAEWTFLMLLGGFMIRLLQRARKRQDLPPPGFVLVFLGLVAALTGTILQMINSLPSGGQPLTGFFGEILGKRLLYQAYLLLPIMGIGAFLLPRFFGLPNRQDFPTSLQPTAAWKRRAWFAAACGGAVLISFALEAAGWWRSGFTLRAVAIAFYFIREVPFLQSGLSRGSLAWALRFALLSIPVGYGVMALFPTWHTGLIHIVFITGFSLLTFTVATRVVLGHSGQSARLKQTMAAVNGVTVLFILAMLTRVSADWMPEVRLSHYGYAAVCWALAVILWLVRFGRSLGVTDED